MDGKEGKGRKVYDETKVATSMGRKGRKGKKTKEQP